MSARSHRVPAIGGTVDEELLYGLLRVLAPHLGQALADDGIRHGFIGGTALKIGYGLTRPSTDLDVKVETPRCLTTHVERAFEQIAGWSYREPTDDEWNRGAEGIIVRHLETGRTLGTRIDFIPGRLHDTDTASIDDRQLEEHHGVRMFGLSDLARYQLNALIGREARKRPRDIYDAAWLMEHWPDAIDAATKTKIAAWHRSVATGPGLYADWETRFRTDNVGRRAPLSTLLPCLSESLEVSAARTRDAKVDVQQLAETDRSSAAGAHAPARKTADTPGTSQPPARRRDRNGWER